MFFFSILPKFTKLCPSNVIVDKAVFHLSIVLSTPEIFAIEVGRNQGHC